MRRTGPARGKCGGLGLLAESAADWACSHVREALIALTTAFTMIALSMAFTIIALASAFTMSIGQLTPVRNDSRVPDSKVLASSVVRAPHVNPDELGIPVRDPSWVLNADAGESLALTYLKKWAEQLRFPGETLVKWRTRDSRVWFPIERQFSQLACKQWVMVSP